MKLLLFALMACVLTAQAQPFNNASAYMSDVLRSPNAATARTKLGITAGTTPTSTGFVKITSGVQEPVASLVNLTSDTTGTLTIARGGSGSTTAAGARVAFGLNIGSDIQAWNAKLDALSALGGTAGILGWNGSGSFTPRTITSGSPKLTISNGNGVSGNPTIDVSESSLSLNNIGGGPLSIANGGTGAASASAARTALGLSIGGDVQAYDPDLSDFAGISPVTGDILIYSSGHWIRLPKGTAGYVLTMGASLPAWADSGTSGGVLGLSDAAYGSSWNATTTVAPSKNALYDYLHILSPSDNGKAKVLDMGAGIVTTDSSGNVSASSVSTTKLGYVGGVTSDIQTQLDAKARANSPVFTGSFVQTPVTVSGSVIDWSTGTKFIKTLTANTILTNINMTEGQSAQVTVINPSNHTLGWYGMTSTNWDYRTVPVQNTNCIDNYFLDYISSTLHGGQAPGQAVTPDKIPLDIGDETTTITSGLVKTFRMPNSLNVSTIRASLTTASSSGIPTIDVKKNGFSILSTLLTIDPTEKTSTTADNPVVIGDRSLGDDDEITVFVSVAGTGAKGLKLWILGTR